MSFEQEIDAALASSGRLIKPRTSGGRESVVRCPYCGDSDNKRHGHLYVQRVPPGLWHCFKCSSSGRVNASFLSDLGADEETSAGAAAAVRRSGSSLRRHEPPALGSGMVVPGTWGGVRVPNEGFKLPPFDRSRNPAGADYLETRMQTALSADVAKRLRIVLNLGDFLDLNSGGIKSPPVSSEAVERLSKRSVGFLQANHHRMTFRSVDPSDRMRHFVLALVRSDVRAPHGFWAAESSVDPAALPLRLHLAEGVFDVIGAMRIAGALKADAGVPGDEAWVAAGGKRFAHAVKAFMLLGFLHLDVRVYADKDVSDDELRDMLWRDRMIDGACPSITVVRNAESWSGRGDAKDFGDRHVAPFETALRRSA